MVSKRVQRLALVPKLNAKRYEMDEAEVDKE